MVAAVAERPPSQLRPRAGARELEPTSKVNGHDPASPPSLAASALPQAAATDALDVGEQIRQLQALAELRAAGMLTDEELTDLKRRVLSSGSDAPLEAPHAGTMQAPHGGRPVSTAAAAAGNGHAPAANTQGSYVTALKVVGTRPITWRLGSNKKRPLYVSWKNALHVAAAKAATEARLTSSEVFSLRIVLRLYAPGGQGSDLDNYVKPIQDALAERGIFGPVARGGSTMKGDERVEHLDVRRRRVSSEVEAGVLAEVWALDG